MHQPLLGLVMIVRDEAQTIESVLESYIPHIDCWTIVDTGSTDGTQEIVRKLFAKHDKPGEIFATNFVDFSTNKNQALDLHGEKSVFTIMPIGKLVADHRLRTELRQWEHSASPPAFRVTVRDYSELPLIQKTSAKNRYKGRTHEYLDVDTRIVGASLCEMVYDRSHRTKEQWEARWQRDIDLLAQDVHSEDTAISTRAWFYLGQTCECLGDFGSALNAYATRAGIPGYFDETYLAKMRIAKMMVKLHRSWPEIMNAYLEAYRFDFNRAEPLYYIAKRYYDGNSPELALMFAREAALKLEPKTDLSFSVERNIYEHDVMNLLGQIHSKLGISAYR